MVRWYRATSLALVVLLLAATGCSSPNAPSPAASPAAKPAAATPAATPAPTPVEQPVTGGQVVIATISDAGSLNPIYAADVTSGAISDLIFDGLAQANDKLEMVPSIAQRWETSPDAKTWTFFLRKDVKWHDGKPVTARDAAFTYWSILHPLYAGVRQSNYSEIQGYGAAKKQFDAIKKDFTDKKIDEKARDEQLDKVFTAFRQTGGIKVVDDYTLNITLEKPYAPFLAYSMGMGLIPEHVLKDVRPDKMKDHDFNRNPLGNGRFKLADWKKGDRIILEANQDWWNGRPYLDRIVYRILPDQNAVAVALETGEVDTGSITPELFDRFKDKSSLKVHEFQTLSYTFLGYNLRRPMFQDKRVRQALTQAIDREAIVEAIVLGHGTLANTHSAPARWDYNDDIPTYRYDKAKATQLLAEAGWQKGSDGILTKDGKPFKFSLYTNQNKVREQIATIVQQQLKEVGVRVETQVLEFQTLLEKAFQNQDFDTMLLGWGIGLDPDAYAIWHSSQAAKGQFNVVGFTDKRVDELLEQGRVELSPAKRKPIYSEFQKILAEELPYTFLYSGNALEVANTKFRGVPAQPGALGIYLEIEKWWLPADKQK